MGIQNYLTFLVTVFVFIMTPGIDTLFIINKSIGQGKRAGIYTISGIIAGVLFHIFNGTENCADNKIITQDHPLPARQEIKIVLTNAAK